LLNNLIEISNKEERIFLTRRKSFPEGIAPETLYDICSENFGEQKRRIILQFGLDTKPNLFTRCTECKVQVEKVIDKKTVQDKIPSRSLEGFNEFYECPKCRKVFWKGAHVDNTIKKRNNILDNKC
jgi:uncharacterized protein with PIN domain